MTGWYLTGFGNETSSGQAVPAVGDGCPDNSGVAPANYLFVGPGRAGGSARVGGR